MPGTTDQPVAVRATAFIGDSRWRRRPVRRVRYDACWADGRVAFDVDLSQAMYRGWPADFAPISDSVHAHCPEVGTGQWVGEFAQVVDGPAQLDPDPPGRRGGVPCQYQATRREPHPMVRLAWRVGAGVVGLGVGILLVTGPSSDGILGPIGVLCCVVGVSSLASTVPRSRRFW